MKPQDRPSEQHLEPFVNTKRISKPQTAKRPPSITTSLFKAQKPAKDSSDKPVVDKNPQSKIAPLSKADSKSFRAKVSIKNKDPIAKESTMKRAKLVSKNGQKSGERTLAVAKKAKKIRKTVPLKNRAVPSKNKESRFKNLQNLNQNSSPKDVPSQAREAKTKSLPQYKQGPSYKKKASLSPFIPICEYFLAEANCSSFNKLVKFYEKDLKEPLFALMLKKFFIKFKANEKYKENLELRKFFYRLRFCKGVTSILKNSTPKSTAEPEAQVQAK